MNPKNRFVRVNRLGRRYRPLRGFLTLMIGPRR
jgi:hypothetical protein